MTKLKKLKVPSLQHMARMWDNNPDVIRRRLVGMAKNGPTFSYAPLFKIVHEMLVFGTSYEVALNNVMRIKRDDVRGYYLSLLPLVHYHFESAAPDFVHEVSPRLYSVSRDIQIPFAPPLVYGANETIVFPWLSFWKTNPLQGEALSLFVTIVEELLLQDSDLDSAVFQILDFSAPAQAAARSLQVLNASEIPRVDRARKSEMLTIFAEGYYLAKAQLDEAKPDAATEEHDSVVTDQIQLF